MVSTRIDVLSLGSDFFAEDFLAGAFLADALLAGALLAGALLAGALSGVVPLDAGAVLLCSCVGLLSAALLSDALSSGLSAPESVLEFVSCGASGSSSKKPKPSSSSSNSTGPCCAFLASSSA